MFILKICAAAKLFLRKCIRC